MTPKLGPQSPSRAADPPDEVRKRRRKDRGFLVGEMLPHLGAAVVEMKVPV